MGILALAADERVAQVNVTQHELSVQLMDGRTISVPLAWYPRLLNATQAQRNNWRISGGGYGIHWEEIDEDLATEGLLRGAPAPYHRQPQASDHSRVSDSTLENQMRQSDLETSQTVDEKGIIDHLLEGEEATTELTEVVSQLRENIETVGKRIERHTSNLDQLKKSPRMKVADVKRLLLLAASDMNSFSKRVEDNLPVFQRDIQVMSESYAAYIAFANAKSEYDAQRIWSFANSIAELLAHVNPVKESTVKFRDSTSGLKDLNLSKDLSKAARRQSKAIEGIISNLEEVKSFALKINFQIEEKFGKQPTED